MSISLDRGYLMRGPQFPILLVLFVLSCVLFPLSASGSEELRKRFMMEYPAQAKRLEEYYSHGIWTATIERPSPDRQAVVGELKLKIAGNMFSLSSTPIAGLGPQQLDSETVILATPSDRIVGINRYARTETYFLNHREYSTDAAWRMLRNEMMPVGAAYSLPQRRVLDYLKENTFKILDVAEAKDADDIARWKVTWEQLVYYDRVGEMRTWGWFVLLVNSAMVIEDYEFAVGSKTEPFSHALRMHVEYGPTPENGFPSITSCMSWVEAGAQRTKEGVERYTKINFESSRIPKNEFLLSAYGIEDFDGNRYGRFTFVIGVFAIAAVLATIGYVFARWSRSLNHPTTSV